MEIYEDFQRRKMLLSLEYETKDARCARTRRGAAYSWDRHGGS